MGGSAKAVLHLGFLSSQDVHMDLFSEDQKLKDYLMDRLNDPKGSEIEKFGIIKFMAQLIQYDS